MSPRHFSASFSLSPIPALSLSLVVSLAFSLALSGCGKDEAPQLKSQTELPI